MKQELPSVSFVTCTFNSGKILKECLTSINNLDYPKKLIEVIIVDGGSSDNTLAIAKTFPFCKILSVLTNGPESATAIGYLEAKNDYIVNFPSDNVIPSKKWLRQMIEPLNNESDIVGVETLHYTYVKNDKILNRYFSLFGVNDPLAYYLNKRDRATYFEKGWHLTTPAIDKGNYYITSFTPENMPTLGANGFIIRKKFAKKIAADPQRFFHIDTCMDLVRNGYNKFAFAKNDIWHKTGEEFFNFIKKRKRYATSLYFQQQATRRYHLFDPKNDKIKLCLFIIFSLTFIEPTLQSIRGYFKIRDSAWFMHPIVCFSITVIYIYTVIAFKLKVVLQR